MGTLSGIIAETPTYELTLPSNGKKVEYRPFLVKEEKILLMASESKSESEIRRAMQDVVSACTFGKIDVLESPLVDVEFLFLKIRSKSVGETAKPQIKCPKCEARSEIVVNLDELAPKRNEENNPRVEIRKDLIVEMHLPNVRDLEKVQSHSNETKRMFALIGSCIDKIYTPKSTFVTKELDEDDVVEFLDSLTQSQFRMISRFFETMPQITKDIDFKCKSCGNEETITLRGAQDFF